MADCKQCATSFEISSKEQTFCAKIQVPLSSFCAQCRAQKRMAWRNERGLHARECDFCKKKIIAAYPSGTQFPVYCNDCWWSDVYDGTQYGRDFDFSKPFFEQFHDLLQAVPRLNLSGTKNENCDYVNYTNYSKDCYLTIGCKAAEKCAYCWRVHASFQCFDCNQLNDCRFCYECVDCDNCYELLYSQNCQNCSSSQYLFNCRNVTDSLACCNLVNKKYCIFNEEYSKEEFEKKSKELLQDPQKLAVDFQKFILKFPHKALNILNSQNCTGDYLLNCKDCVNTFSAKNCQDCDDVFLAEDAVDCNNCFVSGWPTELCYEAVSAGVNGVRNYFICTCWSCSDIQYCDSCFNSQNLFGCIGLKKNAYCILNKQYSKEEYGKFMGRIIEHMKKTGEYGSFFPMNIAPFPYSETIAQEFFPLDKNQIQKSKKASHDARVCEQCGKGYKFVDLEKSFYAKFGIKEPQICPDCRHFRRMSLRNSMKIFDRECAKCNASLKTTYSPDRPEIVYCDSCYLKEVY